MLFMLLLLAATAPPDLSATGIIVSPRPDKSAAILRSAGRSRVVVVGDAAFGGRVSSIESGRVVVEFEGQPVELRLASGQAPRSGLLRPVVAAAPAAATAGGDLTLERRDLERRLASETSRILAETTLVPVQSGSQVTGFTLSRIPEGTILSDAGLQAGDVLTSVNDVPIDSLATLVGLYPRLQSESSVRAVVLRGGVPVTLSVKLR
jgi:general secretion pathway protein C